MSDIALDPRVRRVNMFARQFDVARARRDALHGPGDSQPYTAHMVKLVLVLPLPWVLDPLERFSPRAPSCTSPRARAEGALDVIASAVCTRGVLSSTGTAAGVHSPQQHTLLLVWIRFDVLVELCLVYRHDHVTGGGAAMGEGRGEGGVSVQGEGVR